MLCVGQIYEYIDGNVGPPKILCDKDFNIFAGTKAINNYLAGLKSHIKISCWPRGPDK